MTMKISIEIEPRVSMEITIGEAHSKYIPPPEIGIRSRMSPIELANRPQ
jgi:hypothetical protein